MSQLHRRCCTLDCCGAPPIPVSMTYEAKVHQWMSATWKGWTSRWITPGLQGPALSSHDRPTGVTTTYFQPFPSSLPFSLRQVQFSSKLTLLLTCSISRHFLNNLIHSPQTQVTSRSPFLPRSTLKSQKLPIISYAHGQPWAWSYRPSSQLRHALNRPSCALNWPS